MTRGGKEAAANRLGQPVTGESPEEKDALVHLNSAAKGDRDR